MIMNEYILAIDLGGTSLKIGYSAADLKLIGKISVPTRADMGPECVVDKITSASEELKNRTGCLWRIFAPSA